MASQPPASQETAPRPQVKQPLPKKEKTQCLFCTKPARLTCQHKLCKKCCNERHPSDCKAHDAGPASDKDRSKPTRPQAFLPAQSPALYIAPDAKSVPSRAESTSDHPMLRAVPPGPYATNLTEAVQAHNQEAQESARWQAQAHSQSQQQQSTEGQEALQRYTTAAELLRQLFNGSELGAEAQLGDQSLQLQGGNGDDDPALKRVCQQNDPQIHCEDGPNADIIATAENSLEEPAADVHEDMHTKLMSLQSVLGLPTNRTSIVL
ncbi:hypothetical protein ABBQ38_013504 [Trebouxia sp. C0009 RCD-2024]